METEIPPPPNDQEIRKIIDTLAAYVAKNGAQFEIMVREREKNNAQFFFLRGGDYNKYYTWCLANEHKKIAEAALQAAAVSEASTTNETSQFDQTAAQLQAQVKSEPSYSNGAFAPSYPPPPKPSGFSSQPPSTSGAYSQQAYAPEQERYTHTAEAGQEYSGQEYSAQGYSVPPPQYPQYAPVPRFYPPPWAPPGMERPRMPHEYAQGPPGYGNFPAVRSRFSQGPPPPLGVPPPHMFGPPPNYPMQHFERPFRPGFPPRPGFRPPFHPGAGAGYHGEEVPEEALPPRPQPVPDRPWYELPAGIMMSFIRTEECSYRSLNPKTMVIPPPQLITDKSMRAIDAFYASPSPSQPRNAEGWEKLGLYDFYRAKDAAKKALQRGEKVRQYRPGERSPSPRSRYSSRSRSRSRSRSYSSRSRSRSRSSSRSRGRSGSRSPKRRSPSPAEKRAKRSRSRS